MANKKIIVSSGDGKYQEVPSSSFSVDGDKLIVKNMSVQTASFTGGTSGSIMQISGGILAPIWTTSSILAYSKDENDNFLTPSDLSGTLFQYKTGMENYNGIGPHRIGSASFSGDVVGTISSSIPARVISVANVNSGTLNSQFGGTGTGSFDVGSLVTLSGSGFNPVGNADKIVATNASGDWSIQDKSLLEPTVAPLTGAIVYLYTGSVGTNNTFIWQKPAGTRFIRVICQGGGGGGGGGGTDGTASSKCGGGGGGGGYSDVIFDASSISISVPITGGMGGRGGIQYVLNPADNGGASDFGNYIYANGGSYGITAVALGAGGSGGIGYIISGSGGGTNAVGTNTGKDFGAPGGGAGGTSAAITGRVGGSTNLVSPVANIVGAGLNGQNSNNIKYFNFNKYYLNNNLIQDSNFPNLLSSGGNGGNYKTGTAGQTGPTYKGGNGGSALYGAGGGGGGAIGGAQSGNIGGDGGNGGVGYVLIICT